MREEREKRDNGEKVSTRLTNKKRWKNLDEIKSFSTIYNVLCTMSSTCVSIYCTVYLYLSKYILYCVLVPV